jgi:hypothetical protein
MMVCRLPQPPAGERVAATEKLAIAGSSGAAARVRAGVETAYRHNEAVVANQGGNQRWPSIPNDMASPRRVRARVRAMASSALGIVLGILVGLRHAFEPDHLTAVSTLVSETRSVPHGALLGVLWGVGHTISLVAVGVTLALVNATLPARAGMAFELGVAIMLLWLGARAIAAATRSDASHGQGHDHRRMAAGRRRRWRPLVVGLVHGLAGSGALTAIVFAQLSGSAARITYMVLFGAGSIAGMAIASGVAGATLQLLARSNEVRRRIALATGVVSIAVGLSWGIPLLT